MPQPDKSKFLAIFNSEAAEHLSKLENGLVSLEKQPNQPALIEELNREAHTLKGAARMLGFNDIQDVAQIVDGNSSTTCR